MLAVHASDGVAKSATAALTSLGYSGEHFDAKAQQQYLRARWYDPANGRFNRLDPFAGNMQDPQSLHKYAYVHGDPVQRIDPSGLSALAVGGIGGFSVGMPTSLGLRAQDLQRVGNGAAIALGGIASAMLVHHAISLYGEALASGVRAAADDASEY